MSKWHHKSTVAFATCDAWHVGLGKFLHAVEHSDDSFYCAQQASFESLDGTTESQIRQEADIPQTGPAELFNKDDPCFAWN
ncbi:hypothetical protein FE772_22295 [Lysobacter enzymogenes]|nr:hypothetical protein [Lysobacter enzymogenes]QCW27969.1 hypothetical protein FE772_22295 [Lysobacter enzymogenes]